MTTATVTSKGQITLPKAVRDRLGLAAGDKVEFIETEGGVFQLRPATRDLRELKGVIPRPAKPVTIEDMGRVIARMGSRR
jgi:AbrB family looped-hinge helix DNA binding protein